MLEYLDKQVNSDGATLISALDDFPLWSAPFGLMLLNHIKLRPGIKALDIGFGSGFPLLELAQRLGDSSIVYGIDPSTEAHERTKQKLNVLQIENVRLIEGDACDAQLALTTNPNGHMESFYLIFEETLKELQREDLIGDLYAHIEHRKTADTICQQLEQAGFKIAGINQDSFRLSYLDGTTFFRHALIWTGFLDDWKRLIPIPDQKEVFTALEGKLNKVAKSTGILELTIPIACIEAKK